MSAKSDPHGAPRPDTLVEQFERVLGHAADVICLFDVATDRLYLNAAGRRQFFSPEHEGESEPAFAHVHPEDRELALATFRNIVKTGMPARVELRAIDREGRMHLMRTDASPVRDASGAVIAVLGITHDVTGERRIDAALRLTIKSLFEQPTVAIGLTDLEGHFVSINDAAKRLLGHAPGEDYSKQSVFDVVHPADSARVAALRADLLAGRIPRFNLEKRIVRGDGEVRWVNCSMALVHPPLEGRSFIIVLADDITERKRIEERLRGREELLEAIFDHAPIGISITDKDSRFVRVNRWLKALVGYSDEELLGMSAWDLLPRDEMEENRRRRTELWEGKRDSYSWERRYIRKDGGSVWVENTVSLLRDNEGRPSYVMALVQDITERHLADAAIRATADELQALSRRMVELQETERRDMARELHDRVGQTLTAMRINMHMVRKGLDEQDEGLARSRNEDSIELIALAFRAVENVMYELRPPMLDEYGVVASLKWHARNFGERTGVRVEVHGDDRERCRPEAELAIYRIAQEALNNVARHAAARRVDIEVGEEGPDVVLVVQDDGVGFDLQGESDRHGYGLITMRERAEAVGGTFVAASRKGKGTRITVRVPSR